MHAAAAISPEIDRSECDRQRQHDHIVSLLNTGDDAIRSRRYPEATLAYYSVFQPDLSAEPGSRLRRVAPMELYAEAEFKLRVVATQYAEQLIDCRRVLAGESPDGPVGLPRGALNLYLISNQYDAFEDSALQYAAEELATRNINRFILSSVRARLDHLKNVRACAILLKEEQNALEDLDNFESRLYAHLALQCQAIVGYAYTKDRRVRNAGQSHI